MILKDSLEFKNFFFVLLALFKIQNGVEIQELSEKKQIICNFGFWKIGLFKKYHRTIFLFKLQNG
jgi:hypothetical protein